MANGTLTGKPDGEFVRKDTAQGPLHLGLVQAQCAEVVCHVVLDAPLRTRVDEQVHRQLLTLGDEALSGEDESRVGYNGIVAPRNRDGAVTGLVGDAV